MTNEPGSIDPRQRTYGRGVEQVAMRLAKAETRAALERYRLERAMTRRLFRVALALRESVGPRHWLGFPKRLASALTRVEPPPRPEPVDPRSVIPTLPRSLGSSEKAFEPDYAHLRVLHWGPTRRFESAVPHLPLRTTADVTVALEDGCDLVLIEPAAGEEPPGFVRDGVNRLVEAGIPVVVYAQVKSDLDLLVTEECSTVLVDDSEVARLASERFGGRTLQIAPCIDEFAFNPAGWERVPQESVPALFVSPSAGSHPALAVLPGEAVEYSLGFDPIADDGGLSRAAKRHPFAIVDPSHFPSEATFIEFVMKVVACGTPVLTVDSSVLAQHFPKGSVVAVHSRSDVREAWDQLLSDRWNRERQSVRGRQHVLQRHSVRRRFDEILSHVDIPTLPAPTVSVLLVTKRPDYLEHAFAQIRSQSHRAMELVVVLHGDGFDVDGTRRLADRIGVPATVEACPPDELYGDCLNRAVSLATGDYATKMDDDDHYGPSHIADLLTAIRYSQADIVGKRSNFTLFEASGRAGLWNGQWTERQSSHLPGATILMPLPLLKRLRFGRLNRAVDSDLLRRGREQHLVTYSTHPYNFVRVRHGDHTYKLPDDQFLDHTELLEGDFTPPDVFL